MSAIICIRRHASVHRGARRRRGPSSNCAAGLHQPYVSGWCMSRQLQLNADGKTELIWFGSRASLAKLCADELDLQAGVHTIHPATAVRLAYYSSRN